MSPKAPKKEEKPVEPAEPEVTCPVCGNVVTLDDPFCPHCGAEFEEEEVEEIIDEVEEVELEEVPEAPADEETAEKRAVKEEEIFEAEAVAEEEPAYVEELTEEAEEKKEEVRKEMRGEEEAVVTCPTCGNVVTLDDESCPHCGAVFEEPVGEEEVEVEEEEEAEARPAPETAAVPTITTSLFDYKVIGITLLMLGVICAGIMLNVTWFWTWVPPITSNLVVYALLGIIIVLGSFLYFRKMAKDSAKGKAPPHPLLPSIMLAIFLFGIIAIVLFIAAGPINDALVGSQAGVSLIFVVLAIFGILVYYVGMRHAKSASKA